MAKLEKGFAAPVNVRERKLNHIWRKQKEAKQVQEYLFIDDCPLNCT